MGDLVNREGFEPSSLPQVSAKSKNRAESQAPIAAPIRVLVVEDNAVMQMLYKKFLAMKVRPETSYNILLETWVRIMRPASCRMRLTWASCMKRKRVARQSVRDRLGRHRNNQPNKGHRSTLAIGAT
uniref:Response regulatory domain-containing protein n=1 Tax=Mycena chlorophos TaxID=658473 RepID=A0ABQ0LPG4_MYCCL|nr:predicted protein [Mycena chlorophos]